MLGYSSVRTFVGSHLYYLVAEWLAQRQSDDRYTLGSFPYSVLDQETVAGFYRSASQVVCLFQGSCRGGFTLTLLSAAEGPPTRSWSLTWSSWMTLSR